MNVIDELQQMSVEDIRSHCSSRTINAGVAMINISGDFNFGTMVRNANFFGFGSVYNIADKKKWDKRGSVGTYHYTPVKHYSNIDNFIYFLRSQNTHIIAVENNIPEFQHKTVELFEYRSPIDNVVFLFGEEKCGLSHDVLKQVDSIITISGYGSVRSLNVGTTSGIVMGWHRYLVENFHFQ